jgi:hypothetical protein
MYREEKGEKEDTVPLKGGHTFRVDERVCLQCHNNPKSLVKESQARISQLIKQLKRLLDNASDKTSTAYRLANANYNLVKADGGIGLHNPRYAEVLLMYSISSLRAESVWKP